MLANGRLIKDIFLWAKIGKHPLPFLRHPPTPYLGEDFTEVT